MGHYPPGPPPPSPLSLPPPSPPPVPPLLVAVPIFLHWRRRPSLQDPSITYTQPSFFCIFFSLALSLSRLPSGHPLDTQPSSGSVHAFTRSNFKSPFCFHAPRSVHITLTSPSRSATHWALPTHIYLPTNRQWSVKRSIQGRRMNRMNRMILVFPALDSGSFEPSPICGRGCE